LLPIAVAILVCLVLWIVFTSSRARRFFFLATTLLVAAGCFWFLREELPLLGRKTEAPAKPPYPESMDVSPDELLVENVVVRKPARDNGYYGISGNIANRAKTKTLSAFKLRIVVSDCSGGSRCVIVGDRTIRIKTSVPPGGSRTFDYELTRLAGIPKKDGLSWKWSVVANDAD